MWWVKPGTSAEGVAEAVFNAVWLLLLLCPAVALADGSGSVGLGMALAVLMAVLAIRFGFDLFVARRERERATLRTWMLVVRHDVAEQTVRAVIGMYLGLPVVGALLVFEVTKRWFVPAAVALYAISLLYVLVTVAWVCRAIRQADQGTPPTA